MLEGLAEHHHIMPRVVWWAGVARVAARCIYRDVGGRCQSLPDTYTGHTYTATVPGRKRCGFLTPLPTMGCALLRGCLDASSLRGAFPPIDLRAVCFVRAIRWMGGWCAIQNLSREGAGAFLCRISGPVTLPTWPLSITKVVGDHSWWCPGVTCGGHGAKGRN